MPSRHTITRADEIYVGNANHPGYNGAKHGILLPHLVTYDFGAIAANMAEGLIKDATSTELPNAETVTYTPANDATTPFDATTRPTVTTITVNGVAVSVWDLGGTGRNVTSTTTHGSSIVAMTILVSGYDVYEEAMSELITVPATGTSTTVAGLKAFKYIASIAITSAGNAEANTLDLSTGLVIGLPYACQGAHRLVFARCDGAIDASTIVAAVTTTATTTTGDVRGTITFATAPNGTRKFCAGILVDHTTKALAFGVTQA